ncbi:MAG: TIGR00266 family protein [Planctomycetota bacterium]
MAAHEIDFQIVGSEMQYVVIELDPGETVMAEAGAMMYMNPDIVMQTRMGDGSEKGIFGKLLGAGKRMLTGESLFLTTFTHEGRNKSHVAFGAPYPGHILPMRLDQLGTLLCQKESYLCSALGIEVGIAFTRRFGAGLFGGEGFVLQRLSGDGLAFVHAGGTTAHKTLGPGEELLIDTGCIVAFQESVEYDIQMVKGIKNWFFGGEGLFLARLTGPGQIWLQSLPFSRLANRIYKSAPAAGGRRVGEGSILGGLGGLLDGDNR